MLISDTISSFRLFDGDFVSGGRDEGWVWIYGRFGVKNEGFWPSDPKCGAP